MLIIGCDSPPGFQQIAMTDTDGGDYTQLRLEHIKGLLSQECD